MFISISKFILIQNLVNEKEQGHHEAARAFSSDMKHFGEKCIILAYMILTQEY